MDTPNFDKLNLERNYQGHAISEETKEIFHEVKNYLVAAKAIAKDVFEFSDEAAFNNGLIIQTYFFLMDRKNERLGEEELVDELLTADDEID